MRYKAVVFDLDGTLLDTLADLAAAGNAALEACGFPTHPADAFRRFVGDGRHNMVLRMLPAHAAKDEETVRRAFLAYPKPQQELQRKRVAQETGTDAANNTQVKKVPVRKDKKAGPNDPCPCGSGKKYKKCCMQKDKLAQ